MLFFSGDQQEISVIVGEKRPKIAVITEISCNVSDEGALFECVLRLVSRSPETVFVAGIDDIIAIPAAEARG